MTTHISKIERMGIVLGSKVEKPKKKPSGKRQGGYYTHGKLSALAANFRPAKANLDTPRDCDLPFRKPERGEFNPYPRRKYQ